MKFIKIIGLVLFFHASLLGILFFQPGCQTMQNCCVIDQSPCASECVDYSLESSDIFLEETSVNFVEEMPIKNARYKPTRPAQSFPTINNSNTQTSVPPMQSVQNEGAVYVVKAGDSLWVVAKRHGINVAELASANRINRDTVLKIGQKLSIPAKKGSSGTVEVSDQENWYVIAKGDTLSEIAKRFHVSQEDIKRANNMQDSVIYAGKKIMIPGLDSTRVNSVAGKKESISEKPVVSNEGSYQVKNGDVLSSIAVRFGVNVNDLMKWNNITDARKLRAGQILVIKNPYGTSSTISTSVMDVPTYSKLDEMDAFISETSEESTEGYNDFELFPDDMLFDTSEEIPVVTIVEE